MGQLSPESRGRLATYVSEANFFETVLSNDLDRLAEGSRLVEIGSGIGLLSLLSAEKGFKVTAYEPQSPGFSEMLTYREIIEGSWKGTVPVVEWRDTYFGAETAPPETNKADFAFAINVLEHVPDVESFIADTMRSLLPGGRFRFICPNYAFPYEPHFDLPTLFHKALTFHAFQKWIRSSGIDDPLVVWDELSWPTMWRISRILRRMSLRHSFSRSATEFYLRRVADDVSFSARKGRMVRGMFHLGNATSSLILQLTPTLLLPIIDCTVYRHP